MESIIIGRSYRNRGWGVANRKSDCFEFFRFEAELLAARRRALEPHTFGLVLLRRRDWNRGGRIFALATVQS